MPNAWMNELAMRLLHEHSAECERIIDMAGTGEDRAMSADAHNGAQHLRRNSVSGIAVDHGIEPIPASPVALRIIAEGVYEDINVRQDHCRPSMRSSRAAESSRSIPGATPPPALETGSFTLLRDGLG